MTTDIYEDKMQLAEVLGHMALFSDETVPRNIVPDGWYCCSLEAPGDDPLEEGVLVAGDGRYYCGTILSPVPLTDGKPKPLDGRMSLSGEEITLTDFCRQYGLAYPEDKRRFIFCPDPLKDAPPETEQLLRDTVNAIQKSDLYKEFLRDGREDYYRMELSCILSAPEGSAPDNLTAMVVCLDADGEPDDDETFLFHPCTDREPVQLWGGNWDRDLFDELEKGRGILYMPVSCHAAVWSHLDEYGTEDRLPEGVAKYLRYCHDAGITPEKILEESPALEYMTGAVSRMMERACSPEGMVMM